jgi:hypothetical protein
VLEENRAMRFVDESFRSFNNEESQVGRIAIRSVPPDFLVPRIAIVDVVVWHLEAHPFRK